MAGALEVSDAVSCVTTLFGDETTPYEFRPAVHAGRTKSVGGIFALALILFENGPCSICEVSEVVAILCIKVSSTNPFRNFIGVASDKEMV